MGSVIDHIECPNCGQEAFSDFYYKTGEEYVSCQHCGYHYSAEIINRDKTLDELTDDDWKIKELKNPYGAFRIKYTDSIGYECGSLVNENDYIDLKTTADLNENGAIEFISVSRYVNDEIIKEILIDNGPKYDGAGYSEDDRDWDNTLMDGLS